MSTACCYAFLLCWTHPSGLVSENKLFRKLLLAVVLITVTQSPLEYIPAPCLYFFPKFLCHSFSNQVYSKYLVIQQQH